MPTTFTNVPGKTTVKSGGGKFVSAIATTAPPLNGRFSVHDCADPGQASALNCIFPMGWASPADGVTFKNGLTVHTTEGGGVFTITIG